MLSQWCFVARRQSGARLKLVSTLSAFIDLSYAGNHLGTIEDSVKLERSQVQWDFRPQNAPERPRTPATDKTAT